MITTLIQLAITPLVLLVASKSMKGVHIKDTRAAVITTVAIFVMSFLVGWLLTLVLNIATMGLLWAVGLGVITRIVANAIVIEIVDQFSEDFETDGFLPSLWLAILLAMTWGVVDYFFQ